MALWVGDETLDGVSSCTTSSGGLNISSFTSARLRGTGFFDEDDIVGFIMENPRDPNTLLDTLRRDDFSGFTVDDGSVSARPGCKLLLTGVRGSNEGKPVLFVVGEMIKEGRSFLGLSLIHQVLIHFPTPLPSCCTLSLRELEMLLGRLLEMIDSAIECRSSLGIDKPSGKVRPGGTSRLSTVSSPLRTSCTPVTPTGEVTSSARASSRN